MNRLFQLFATLVTKFGRLLAWLYYSPIKIVGQQHLPKKGAVILVSNHANSLIDPVLVGLAARRRVRFLSRASLFRVPIIGAILKWMGVIPVFRTRSDEVETKQNIDSFSEVVESLRLGAAIGVFPEGRTHDDRALSDVDGGVASLVLQAMDEGVEDLQVVPVGINYDDKRVFRSAVWVEVGEPIDFSGCLTSEVDRAKKRGAITEEVCQSLRKVVIHLDDPDLDSFLTDLEYLDPVLAESGKHRVFSLQQRKSVADALNHFMKERPGSVQSVGRSLAAHRKRLNEHGLTVDAEIINLPWWRRVLLHFGRTVRLGCGLLPVCCGVIQNAPPVWISRMVVRFLPQVRASRVAVSRLAVALPVFVFWYIFTGLLLSTYFLPWVVVFWLLVTPLSGLFALRYFRSLFLVFKAWRQEIWMWFNYRKLKNFRAGQEKLVARFKILSDEYDGLRCELPQKKPRWIKRPQFHFAVLSCIFVLGVSFFMMFALRMGFRESTLQILMRPAPNYQNVSSDVIQKMLDDDENRLATVLAEMDDLGFEMKRMKRGLSRGKYTYYSDEDNDRISQTMLTYLNCRRELLDLILQYRARHTIGDRRLELRASLVDTAAACKLYAFASEMVDEAEGDAALVAKLNEGDAAWGIPPGLFDAIRDHLNHEPNLRPLRRALIEYKELRSEYESEGLLNDHPQAVFHKTIRDVELQDAESMGVALTAWREAMYVKDDLAYQGQSTISQVVGNTRVRQREAGPRLRPSQLGRVRKLLRPGDIIIERQDWYLSRAFMPGYWAHAALYVGTPEEIESMGLQDHPWVKPHWKEFKAEGSKGEVHAIIEAVPAGVRFTTLEHCLGIADSAAVLRPGRVSEDDIKEAVVRAFRHLGKPYDFEFDFFSADKLICTELVARAFSETDQLNLETVDVMGRQTVPPTEMVRKFAQERRQQDRQLDFIIFYDGHAGGSRCIKRGEKALADTVDRKGMTWFNSLD